ncbi:MAG: hypothetical protein NZ534_09430 [Bacteroidia bacterium]|nr:hypothetical protein [Bacteroidia bacterium]
MGQTPSTLQHVCSAAVTSVANVFGQKRRLEHATGLLDAILSDANYSAFEGTIDPGFQDKTTGHVKNVRITWHQRVSPANLEVGYQSICDVDCTTPTAPEEIADIDWSVGHCVRQTEAQIRQLCAEASQLWSGNFKKRGNYPTPPTMMELGTHILRAISGVRAGINAILRHIINSQAPTFSFAGPSPSPSPLPVTLTSTSADQIRTGGLVRIFEEFAKAEYTGEIIVVSDINPMYRAAQLLGASCCNLQGVDNKVLATDRMFYFLDTGLNSNTTIGTTTYNGLFTGTPVFLAWIPGALRLVSVNDFVSDEGTLGLAFFGNGWQTVIPDPIHGDKLLHDVRVAYDGCGTWSITVGNRFDLLVKPNLYAPGDNLSGVRDVFLFRADAVDPCVQVCS